MSARKIDATGRSAAYVRPGRARRWRLEGPFIAHPLDLRESPGFMALTVPARRALDFIEREHLRHGGQDNGRLHAPYTQLQKFGISSRDVGPALQMLEAFGIIHCSIRGERLGGRNAASRYALTWYPVDGQLPTNAYRRVTPTDVAEYLNDLARRKLWKERLSGQ